MENIYVWQIQIYECLKGNPTMITVNANYMYQLHTIKFQIISTQAVKQSVGICD